MSFQLKGNRRHCRNELLVKGDPNRKHRRNELSVTECDFVVTQVFFQFRILLSWQNDRLRHGSAELNSDRSCHGEVQSGDVSLNRT